MKLSRKDRIRMFHCRNVFSFFVFFVFVLFYSCDRENEKGVYQHEEEHYELYKLNNPKLVPKNNATDSSIFNVKFKYAIQSCEIKLEGRFLVDNFNSFCGDYPTGITFGDIAYANKIVLKGKNHITGHIFKLDSCSPSQSILSEIIYEMQKAVTKNSDFIIPADFLEGGKLILKNNDILILPSGIYYFKGIEIEGEAILEFSGLSAVFVDGNINIKGKGEIKSDPFLLRIVSTGKINVEGKGKISGGILAREIELKGESQIFGCVFSESFEAKGRSAVHCDRSLMIDRIKIFPDEITMSVGEEINLNATVIDIWGKEVDCMIFDWVSSDTDIVTVDNSGLVKGINPGNGIIYVYVKIENYSILVGEVYVNVVSKTFSCPYGFWATFFGGQGESSDFVINVDDGFIVGGRKQGGRSDAYLSKVNKMGEIVWAKLIDIGDIDSVYYYYSSSERFYEGIKDRNGDIIMVGYYNMGSNYDVLVIKTDVQGNVKWYKIIGDTYTDEIALSVTQDVYGNYLIVGFTRDISETNIYIVRLSEEGELQWVRTIGGITGSVATDVIVTPYGEYILSGYTEDIGEGPDPVPSLRSDIFILKLDIQGNILWAKEIGGSGSDFSSSILMVGNSYIVSGGTSSFGAGGFDTFILSVNNSGNVVWAKTISTIAGDINEFAKTSILGNDDEIIVGGFTEVATDNVFVLKISQDGFLRWITYVPVKLKDGADAISYEEGGKVVVVGNSYFLRDITNDPYIETGIVAFEIGTSTGCTCGGIDISRYILISDHQVSSVSVFPYTQNINHAYFQQNINIFDWQPVQLYICQ